MIAAAPKLAGALLGFEISSLRRFARVDDGTLVMAGIDAAKPSGETRQQPRFPCARFGGLVALVFGGIIPRLDGIRTASCDRRPIAWRPRRS